MKQESDLKPIKSFEIENNNDGSCDVILNDLNSIEEETITDEEGNKKITYKYFAFRIKLEYSENVFDYIEKNYETLLNDAKEHDRNIFAKNIREKRNVLLAESDKEMAFDRIAFDIPSEITMTNVIKVIKSLFGTLSDIKNSKWSEYRQQLRDITKQEGFPYNVEWPEKPSK